MTDHPSHPMPYPGLDKRVERLEQRHDNTDTAVSGLIATTAVHSEQVGSIKEDIRDLIHEIAKANARVTSILRAVWGLVLVLVPVAVGLITIAIQGR